MTKKRILALILALCMLFTIMAFATSCSPNTPDNGTGGGGTGDGGSGDGGSGDGGSGNGGSGNGGSEAPSKPTITVTVVDSNGNPIAGALVQICHGTVCRQAAPTNAEGKLSATFTPKGALKAMITEAEGYVFSDDYYNFAEGSYELTITLEAE